MNADPIDPLIEAATSAYRERDADGRIRPAPEWWDLSPEGRERLFDHQLASRRLERSVDPSGWSSTVKAVLQRIG